ncbi:flagellar hook-associated protein 3 [bacterium]|nr:flagellar hook-associated protein 3 [bacterium]
MARVTEGLLYEKADRAMHRTRNTLLKNQEQAISGKRINRPSDDPQGMIRSIGLKHKVNRNEQALKNMELANSYLSVTDSSLGEMTSVLSRAKELAIQMSSGTNQAPEAMQAVKSEVDELFFQAVQLANARIGEHYVFAGYQTDHPPFDVDGNYYGDTGAIEIEVQPGQRVQFNMPGLAPFLGVEEIPNKNRELGSDRGPTVGPEFRDPASIVAHNQGVDPGENPEAFASIQSNTGVNVFAVLKTFSEGLATGRTDLINESLESLDQAMSQVSASRATIGALQNSVISNRDLVESQQVTNKTLLSNVEDADLEQVYSELARNESLLSATLDSNKKLLTPSLLDFLR